MRFASALSLQSETDVAVVDACVRVAERVESPQLVMVFFTRAHRARAAEIVDIVRDRLDPGCWIGVSAEGVAGTAEEVERAPGVSVIAGSLPGVRLHAFDSSDVTLPGDPAESHDLLRRSIAGTDADDLRGVIFAADPFSVPLTTLLPVMSTALAKANDGGPTPILGGVASAGQRPGDNVLILGTRESDRILRQGAVGIGISGDVRIDPVVSQGCRPIGDDLIVTKARRNIVFELGGRPAATVVRETLGNLSEDERKQLVGGLYLGRVVNEYKERFGRGDYLIRSVTNLDANSGAIAVGDLLRVGQTVRLHLRDTTTASEDLSLLLDAQKLHGPPAGALLVTCNGRGTRMFDEPHHDAAAIARAFVHAESGVQQSKGGKPLPEDVGDVPLAGFFAAGEIGPVGRESYLHGQTACAALFRQR